MSYDEIPEGPTVEEMLIFAICNNDRDLVLHLLAVGAELDCHDWFGATPLQNATTPEMVQLLIGEGADPDQLDQKGRTAWITLPELLTRVMQVAFVEKQRESLAEETPLVSLARARRL